MIARGHISDASSILAASTITPGSPLVAWQLPAGPAPYGGALVSTGCCERAGGNGQATDPEGANHKGQLQRVCPADGCLAQSEAAPAGRAGTEARHTKTPERTR